MWRLFVRGGIETAGVDRVGDQIAEQAVQAVPVEGPSTRRVSELGADLDVLALHPSGIEIAHFGHDLLRVDIRLEVGLAVLGAVEQVLDDAGDQSDISLHHLPTHADGLAIVLLETVIDDEDAALEPHEDVLDPVCHPGDRAAGQGELSLQAFDLGDIGEDFHDG